MGVHRRGRQAAQTMIGIFAFNRHNCNSIKEGITRGSKTATPWPVQPTKGPTDRPTGGGEGIGNGDVRNQLNYFETSPWGLVLRASGTGRAMGPGTSFRGPMKNRLAVGFKRMTCRGKTLIPIRVVLLLDRDPGISFCCHSAGCRFTH